MKLNAIEAVFHSTKDKIHVLKAVNRHALHSHLWLCMMRSQKFLPSKSDGKNFIKNLSVKVCD